MSIQENPGATPDRRRRYGLRRWAAGVAMTLGASSIAAVIGGEVAGATPWLTFVRTIQTNPFTGTTTKMSDDEGMAYVPANNKLWVVDDSKGQLYSVDKDTGVLGQVITRSQFQAAPQLGQPGTTAVLERTLDMEAVAYDEPTDTLYVFSGHCCTSATLPTVYRLKRASTAQPFAVESWQPLTDPLYNDFSGVGIRQGEIWAGYLKQLLKYDYPTNTITPMFTLSGVSAIYGVGFSADGADMWIAGSGARIAKYDWATKTIVPGFSFTMSSFGVNDARAVEVIGSQLFVSDGYDYYGSSDPNAFGIRVYNIVDVTIPAPVASFTKNKSGGLAPSTVSFTDTSTNNPQSWSWSFGDGSTSTTRNPAKTYSVPGVYNVTLTATNPGGSSTTAAQTITVTGASFTSNLASGTAPVTINFTDTSTNAPTAWLWTFGDGTTSTTRNPSKTFSTPGVFQVTLKATGPAGAHTTAPREYIISAPQGPVASFTKSTSSGAAPLSVDFTDTSSNFPTSWSWSWGDGTPNSTDQHPTHVFTNPGTYNVTLTATNTTGSMTSASQTITVIPAGTEVTATFTPTEDAFIELITPSTTRATSSTLYNVVTATNTQRSYLKFNVTGIAGTVASAKLRLWTTDGTDNGAAWYRVTDNNWTQATLTWNNAPSLTGQTLVADPGTVVVSTWNEINVAPVATGNGVFTFASLPTSANSERYSSKEGTNPPQLVITYLAGGPPVPVASFTKSASAGVAPLTVNFTDTSTNNPTSWLWSWGDGTPDTTTQDASHTFASPGSYDVTLTATNAAGSNTTVAQTITVTPPVIVPVASFTKSVASGTAPLSVDFTDTSTNIPTSWVWSWGDGTANSTTQHASHVFAAPGTYNVTLTATNAAGSNTSAAQTVTVTSAPVAPVASFTKSASSGAAPLVVDFTDTSTNTPTSWSWSFGDGTTSTLQNPSKTYSAAGSYNVTLTATNAAGSNTSAAQVVTVTAGPTVTSFAPTDDSYVQLTTPTTPRGTVVSLLNVQSATQTQRTYLKFNPTGLTGTVTNAKLRLWVTDGTTDGAPWYRISDNTWTESSLIWNNAPAVAGQTLLADPAAVTVSTWLEIDVTSAVTGNGTVSFATLPTSSNSERYSSKEAATNRPELVITTTPSAPQPPVASFTKSASSGTAPLTVDFTDTSTNSPTSWVWAWGDGTANSTTQNASHTFTAPGTYNVTLTATNAGGSNTSSAQTVTVTAAPQPPVASFTKSASSGTAPLTVDFTDTSTNTPTSWVWAWGDGTANSTTQNASHTFTAAGTYNVTLTATNGAGSNTSAAQTITVTTGGGGGTTTFIPTDDSYIDSAIPTTPKGTSSQLYNVSPSQRSYLKFTVAGLTGTVTNAKLRLWVTDGTTDGAAWYRISDNTWTQALLTWSNAPTLTGATLVGDPAAVAVSTWLEIDVTAVVNANGTYSFANLPTSANGEKYASKETAVPANAPQLVITTS